MKMALEEACKASAKDEVPVGAILVSPEGEVLAKAHNQKEIENDPLGHAEILVLREAAKKVENWRLEGCILYVTLEPCPMCLAAMIQARIKGLVFGAYDKKGGAISLNYNLYKDQRLNHNFFVLGGVKHLDCSNTLTLFFKEKVRLKESGKKLKK